MNIIVFEDDRHKNFYPLSLTKPLWELRSGLFSFQERLALFVRKNPGLSEGNLSFFTRDYLAPYYRQKYPHLRINDGEAFEEGGDFFFINAFRYPSPEDFAIDANSVVLQDGVPVAARVEGGRMKKTAASIPAMLGDLGLSAIEHSQLPGRRANFIWELMDSNPETIRSDFELAGYRGKGTGLKDVTISGDASQVYIEEDAVFEPYVFIDASKGPVFIGARSRINSFSRIEGPCVIGRDCVIYGAKIRSGTSIGDFCRIGGEIEQSIFHGYGNKYHDGFIGHSYIGEWVNMGAMTTNSDLKNNYANVKVYIPGSRKKTGLKKVGCFMGDFVKTSIGTLINTGTSIGTGAMLVHAGLLTPFHIPPFSWYIDAEIIKPAMLDDFITACREAMARRNVVMTEEFIILIKSLNAMTSSETDEQ